MIRARVADQASFGASHRGNVDTPPLEGNCRETSGISPVTNRELANKSHERTNHEYNDR